DNAHRAREQGRGLVQHLNEVWILQHECRLGFGARCNVGDVALGERLKEREKVVVGNIEVAGLVAELFGSFVGGENVGKDVRFRQIRALEGARQQRLQERGTRALRASD